MNQRSVEQHYSPADLKSRVAQSLAQAGLTHDPLDWRQLAPLDQFHVRGLAATAEMASHLSLKAGATVLDVGCGLGGPARYLAALHRCRVTGIDLSHPFVEVARMLTERVGLAESVTFVQGDALALPFPDASFDYAWTQHVAMNIADRAGLYAGIHRVLKPGGMLAIYDVVAGNGEPLTFPLPWARTAETSFLLTADAMRDVLREVGFTEVLWEDATDTALAWFAEQTPTAPGPLNLGVIMGDDFGHSAANVVPNAKMGRIRLLQAIVRRN